MTSQAPSIRRHDLDWLRVLVFALLILYHTGMFYVTWDWHVKSPRALPALEPLMQLSSPWRMGLLFLISGAATRFMAERLPAAALAQDRFHRLFWPLLFGIFVVVPPQAYLEIVEKISWSGGFSGFYRLYVQGYDGWCRGDDCLIVPTWNHLWFVAYALVYALLLAAALAIAPKSVRPTVPDGWSAPLFLIAPWLWLWAMRTLLFPRFGSTHALVDDWYNHAIYLPLFLLGFGFVRSEQLAALTVRMRWPALAAALLGYAGVQMLSTGGDTEGTTLLAARGLRELQAWGAILACLGFARHHLAQRGGPTLHWLTRAIFPCYIVHQTIIVVAGHHLARLGLPLAVEAAVLVLVTAAGCLLAAVAAMRWAPLGLVLGVQRRSPPPPLTSVPA